MSSLRFRCHSIVTTGMSSKTWLGSLDAAQVRTKGRNSSVDVYVVHSSILLVERIIPFFERNELRVKRKDFESFAFITKAIRTRSHHRPDVFTEVVQRAYSMNARGKQRKRPIEEILGSSETTREVPLDG